ncbi:MAG: tol-pal system protein YbgF [Rhodocyclaceae bacterium]|nr:tol-pal system protein YbgF [Rhodocyclaceae bacterium]
MTRRPPFLPVLLLAPLLALSTLPAWAGVFDGDALKAVTLLRNEHDAKLNKLEEAAQNQLEAANQLEGLKAEVARLRGQVEVLTFELGQAQKRMQDYYVDLDNRLRKQEAALAAAEAAPKQPAVADPALETQAFEAALNLFKANKFKESADAFGNLIASYPAGAFAPSAHFWAGNAYFQLREWAKAVELYSALVQKWPGDAKAPDALLQLSEARRESGDAKAAQDGLEDLVLRYPDSPAAATAKQRLAKKKGH